MKKCSLVTLQTVKLIEKKIRALILYFFETYSGFLLNLYIFSDKFAMQNNFVPTISARSSLVLVSLECSWNELSDRMQILRVNLLKNSIFFFPQYLNFFSFFSNFTTLRLKSFHLKNIFFVSFRRFRESHFDVWLKWILTMITAFALNVNFLV